MFGTWHPPWCATVVPVGERDHSRPSHYTPAPSTPLPFLPDAVVVALVLCFFCVVIPHTKAVYVHAPYIIDRTVRRPTTSCKHEPIRMFPPPLHYYYEHSNSMILFPYGDLFNDGSQYNIFCILPFILFTSYPIL